MRVLVVEDEHRIAGSIKKGLEQEKYVVDLAFDGKTGLNMALDGGFDVIVLDLMLPQVDGLSVCKTLRDNSVDTPILILTAKGQITDKVKGLDLGADDYMVKPFSFEEFLSRLKAITRRPKALANKTITVNDLEIDTEGFVVKRQGKEIQLSSKEYSIIELLAKHKGQVVSKEKIIDRVWNYDTDVLPNTVEVFIKNLRRKIDNPFPKSDPLIHTIRGFGYKLDDKNV